jgi:hypothetical protein
VPDVGLILFLPQEKLTKPGNPFPWLFFISIKNIQEKYSSLFCIFLPDLEKMKTIERMEVL